MTACLFCGLGMGGFSVGWAQHKSNRLEPRFVSSRVPDEAEGRTILQQFRSLGISGDYFLEFELRVLPRRGASWVVPGAMWGTRTAAGPLTRVELAADDDPVERYLIQNGDAGFAWRYRSGQEAAVRELAASQLMDSMAQTGISVFELQMPFIYWRDYVFEGTTRLRGRTVHAFLMYPPEEFAATNPGIGGVRLHLDPQYHALVQAVILDQNEIPLRKFTVLDLKKLGDQWIVKSIDVREEATRDKVRFQVTGAALRQDFARGLFEPESLTTDIAEPAMVDRW